MKVSTCMIVHVSRYKWPDEVGCPSHECNYDHKGETPQCNAGVYKQCDEPVSVLYTLWLSCRTVGIGTVRLLHCILHLLYIIVCSNIHAAVHIAYKNCLQISASEIHCSWCDWGFKCGCPAGASCELAACTTMNYTMYMYSMELSVHWMYMCTCIYIQCRGS